MSLAQLETVFKRREAIFEREKDALILRASKKGVAYPVIFTEEQHGWVQALLWFAPPQKPIKNGRALCREIKEWFGDGVDVGFSKDRFYIGSFVESNKLWDETNLFLERCDVLYPLFNRAGEIGGWDFALLQLAFMPDEYFCRA